MSINIDDIQETHELLEKRITLPCTQAMEAQWNKISERLGRSKIHIRNNPAREAIQEIIDQFNELFAAIDSNHSGSN